MNFEDLHVVTTDGTAGLGTASQLVGGTALSIATADLNLTSLAPSRILRVRRRELWTSEVSMNQPPRMEKKKRTGGAQRRDRRHRQTPA